MFVNQSDALRMLRNCKWHSIISYLQSRLSARCRCADSSNDLCHVRGVCCCLGDHNSTRVNGVSATELSINRVLHWDLLYFAQGSVTDHSICVGAVKPKLAIRDSDEGIHLTWSFVTHNNISGPVFGDLKRHLGKERRIPELLNDRSSRVINSCGCCRQRRSVANGVECVSSRNNRDKMELISLTSCLADHTQKTSWVGFGWMLPLVDNQYSLISVVLNTKWHGTVSCGLHRHQRCFHNSRWIRGWRNSDIWR
mmetsp:Transcript_10590/g.22924  ORF Transcript_10590/g.22924 Transcript_10590/m.22924 type:complete len:253 (+) Transcript_10590:781-1539(+)